MKIFGWLTNGIKAIKGCIRDISNYRAFRKFVKAYENEPGSVWYQLKLHSNKLKTLIYKDIQMPKDWQEYGTDEMRLSYLYDQAKPLYQFLAVDNMWGESLSMSFYHFEDTENPQNVVYTYRIEFEYVTNWLGSWYTFRQILYMLLGLGVIATGIVFLCLYA